jgi:hypothetical protein
VEYKKKHLELQQFKDKLIKKINKEEIRENKYEFLKKHQRNWISI